MPLISVSSRYPESSSKGLQPCCTDSGVSVGDGSLDLLRTAVAEDDGERVLELLEDSLECEFGLCDALPTSISRPFADLLTDAVRMNRPRAVQSLLQAGVRPDDADRDGWTPLRLAAREGHGRIVKILLDFASEVDGSCNLGRTALREACWAGRLNVVQILLHAGADVDSSDTEGRTPLMTAAYLGREDVLRLLLMAQPEVDKIDTDGRTALCVASICRGNLAGIAMCCRLLLDAGADVSHGDISGASSLHLAASAGAVEVCELFLARGADIEALEDSGRTPLFIAVAAGHIEVVSLLLEWGASVCHLCTANRSVLSEACMLGHTEIVELLLRRGLDETHRDIKGDTTLHLAAIHGHAETVQMLLDWGAEVDALNARGKTPLLLACASGDTGVVRLLVTRGANIEARTPESVWPLRAAAVSSHIQVVDILLETGADPDAIDADGFTTLHCLAYSNRLESALALLRSGADVNRGDLCHRSPLYIAAWSGHDQMCAELLSYGAQVDMADKDGLTALHSGVQGGHETVVELLIAAGANLHGQVGSKALKMAQERYFQHIVSLLKRHGVSSDDAHHFPSSISASDISHHENNKEVLSSLVSSASSPRLGVTSRHFGPVHSILGLTSLTLPTSFQPSPSTTHFNVSVPVSLDHVVPAKIPGGLLHTRSVQSFSPLPSVHVTPSSSVCSSEDLQNDGSSGNIMVSGECVWKRRTLQKDEAKRHSGATSEKCGPRVQSAAVMSHVLPFEALDRVVGLNKSGKTALEAARFIAGDGDYGCCVKAASVDQSELNRGLSEVKICHKETSL